MCIFAAKLNAMRYYDPRYDTTFKKVFSHPELLISFLNALLPLKDDERIESVEYLSPELVPKTPEGKFSIVDVCCKDKTGRQFIVEMQMVWSEEFKSRVLFNASKAYVQQLGKGEKYHLLKPVYSLNLVNEVFEPELPENEYYHFYQLVHERHTDKVIEGLHIVFIELPKFKPRNWTEERMKVLWLRFLTEINADTRDAPAELVEDPLVGKAVSLMEESAMSDEDRYLYEKSLDNVRVELAIVGDATKKGFDMGYEEGMEKGRAEGIEKGKAEGIKKGLAEGKAEGIAEGKAEGEAHANRENARKMKALGLAADLIAQVTGLAAEEIESL